MNDRIERWDRWDTRLPNPKDQQRAIDLFQRSGAQTKSDFVRGRILGESFKVITVDKSAVEYYRKLSELTAQIHKIGGSSVKWIDGNRIKGLCTCIV